MLKLSRRLQLIYDCLLPNQPVWDMCCDHGYLGLNAYESGQFPEVHFVDQVPHIMEALQFRFQSEYYKADSTTKAFFHSTAAQGLTRELNGNLVIAGVGAHTILRILHESQIAANARLILVPQRDEEFLLRTLQEWAHARSFRVQQTLQVNERGRVRTLHVVEPMTRAFPQD